jgi:hypothetical protein
MKRKPVMHANLILIFLGIVFLCVSMAAMNECDGEICIDTSRKVIFTLLMFGCIGYMIANSLSVISYFILMGLEMWCLSMISNSISIMTQATRFCFGMTFAIILFGLGEYSALTTVKRMVDKGVE